MQIANEYKAQQTAVCSLLGGIVADYFKGRGPPGRV